VHARSTTVRAHPESIDAGIAHIRDEVMPMLSGMEGCVGLSMLADRTSGRCIITSAWQSEEAMRASAEQLRPVRDRAAEMLGGRAQVDEWEIAVLHRDHASEPGACVRATWLRTEPGQTERLVEFYRMELLPAIQEYEGFCSASLMVDHAGGYLVSSVTFDGLDSMAGTREQAMALRDRATGEIGGEIVDVGEFELVLAHLRVPEMA
jgi:quinol monooxygenase YgiN